MSLCLPSEASDKRPIFTAGHVSDWMLVSLTNNHPPERKVWNAEQSLNSSSGMFRLRVVNPDDIPLVRRGLQGLIGVTDSSLQSTADGAVDNPFKYALRKAAAESSGGGARRSSFLAAPSGGVPFLAASVTGGSSAVMESTFIDRESLSQQVTKQSVSSGRLLNSAELSSKPLTRAERYYQQLLRAEERIQRGWEEAALAEENERAAQMSKQAKDLERRSTEPVKPKAGRRRGSADTDESLSSLLLSREEGSKSEEQSSDVLPYDGRLQVEIEVVVLPNDPESRSTGSAPVSEIGSSPRFESQYLDAIDGSVRSDSALSPKDNSPGRSTRVPGKGPRRASQGRRQRESTGSGGVVKEQQEARIDLSAELNALKAEMDMLHDESYHSGGGRRDDSESSSNEEASAKGAKKKRTRNIKDDEIWARRHLGLGGSAFYVPDVERYALAHSLPPPPPSTYKTKLKPRLPLDVSCNRYKDEAPSVFAPAPEVALTEERALKMERTMRIADFYNALSRSMTALDRMTMPGGLSLLRKPPPRKPLSRVPTSQSAQLPAGAPQSTQLPVGTPQSTQVPLGTPQSTQLPARTGSALRNATPASYTTLSSSGQTEPERLVSEPLPSDEADSEDDDLEDEQLQEPELITRLPPLPRFNRGLVEEMRKAISVKAPPKVPEPEEASDDEDSDEDAEKKKEAEETSQPVKIGDAKFGALVDFEARKSLAWRSYKKREFQRQKLILHYKTPVGGREDSAGRSAQGNSRTAGSREGGSLPSRS